MEGLFVEYFRLKTSLEKPNLILCKFFMSNLETMFILSRIDK